MRRTQVLWEAYVRRFEDAFDRYRKGRLTAEEAGELLNLSGRHFRRQCGRFEAEGVEGLRDRRLGRVSGHRADEGELERMRRLYKAEYSEFLAMSRDYQDGIARQSGWESRCGTVVVGRA